MVRPGPPKGAPGAELGDRPPRLATARQARMGAHPSTSPKGGVNGALSVPTHPHRLESGGPRLVTSLGGGPFRVHAVGKRAQGSTAMPWPAWHNTQGLSATQRVAPPTRPGAPGSPVAAGGGNQFKNLEWLKRLQLGLLMKTVIGVNCGILTFLGGPSSCIQCKRALTLKSTFQNE